MSPPLALLFGASRGLGLALAHRLGDRGHRLVISARDVGELDRAAADLVSRGYDVTAAVCDVTDETAVRELVERIEREVGPVEVALVVAGIIQVGPLDALQRSHFEQAIDVMLWGPVNAAFAVLPAMRQRRRGRIGVITSIGGLIAAPHLLPYSTAKFGAVGFSRGLRSELAGTGVTVTTVAPGLMRTGSHVRAQFVGDHAAEYAWFATAASLPVLSMDADRAAAKIIDGVLRGRSTVLLTPLAQVASRVAGSAPALTAAVLSLTARLLPPAPHGATATIEGTVARQRLTGRRRALVDRLTTLGDRAGVRLLEGDDRAGDDQVRAAEPGPRAGAGSPPGP